MERVFSDLEGLRIAMEMEKRGVELYGHAARVSVRPEAVALLKRLMQDEQEHRDEFARRYEYRAREGAGAVSQYDVETAAYLSAIAADIVFPGGLTDLARGAGLNDPARILRHAIQSEKDSILFYEEMAARALGDEERAVFSEIAFKEKGHMAELMRMLKEEAP